MEEGLIKGIGLSEISAADIRKAHAVHPITAVELEWSLFSRDAEVCLVVPSCPLWPLNVAYALWPPLLGFPSRLSLLPYSFWRFPWSFLLVIGNSLLPLSFAFTRLPFLICQILA